MKKPETDADAAYHELLAAIDSAHDRAHIEDRWSPHGYTISTAAEAKAAYENWSGETISFDCVDQAILGTNDSGGLFPARLEAFFAAWIISRLVRLDIMEDHEKLKRPSAHTLPELFRALKWGRPGNQQAFLLKLADNIEGGELDGGFRDLLDDDDRDNADWWKS